MPNVYHDVPVSGSLDEVYDCVSTPRGLSRWWAKSASGVPAVGNKYEFDFGPGYQWQAEVIRCEPNSAFAIKMTRSDRDWDQTTVSFQLIPEEKGVMLRFAHEGWPQDNPHFRTSSYCWAMYLRCLKGYVENGIELEYEDRLEGT